MTKEGKLFKTGSDLSNSESATEVCFINVEDFWNQKFNPSQSIYDSFINLELLHCFLLLTIVFHGREHLISTALPSSPCHCFFSEKSNPWGICNGVYQSEREVFEHISYCFASNGGNAVYASCCLVFRFLIAILSTMLKIVECADCLTSIQCL